MSDSELKLADQVYTETDMLALLGISRATLDYQRLEKGMPYVKLGNSRVYLADQVLNWLKANGRGK